MSLLSHLEVNSFGCGRLDDPPKQRVVSNPGLCHLFIPFCDILCILYLVITFFILFPFYNILVHSGVLSPWPVFFRVFIDLLVEAFGVLITWLDSFYLDLALGMLRVVPQLQMFLRQKVWMGLNQKLWIGVKDMKSSSCTQWPWSMPCQGRVAVIGPNGAGKSTMIKAGCTCHLSTFKSLGTAVLWKHVIFSSTLCQFFGGTVPNFDLCNMLSYSVRPDCLPAWLGWHLKAITGDSSDSSGTFCTFG